MNARLKPNDGGVDGLLRVDAARTSEPLRECVRDALSRYFRQLDGHDVCDLFEFVMGEVEAPLLESVLEHTRGNLTKAAAVLGINRGTLRK